MLSFKNRILLCIHSSFRCGILSFIGLAGVFCNKVAIGKSLNLWLPFLNLIGIVSCLALTIFYTTQSRSAKQQFTSNNPINRTPTRWLELVPRHYSQQVCAVY